MFADAEIERLQKQLAEATVKEKSSESDQPKNDKTTEPKELDVGSNIPHPRRRGR